MTVASFPSIKPSSRTWTPGSQPVQSFTALSGYEARVLLGPNPIGATLSLGFQNLTEAVFLLITNHYATAKGTYEDFDLPADIFAGMSSYSGVTPSGYKWRYSAAPTVEWTAPGIGNASVSLLAVRA
jgi:hypothetical protein